LVIQAQPFGETEVAVFDTVFLPVPAGPAPRLPAEAPAPGWVEAVPDAAATDRGPWAPGDSA